MLANIFMHHAFDEWMRLNHPYVLFERYADDVLVHCKTEQQAKLMLSAIERRLAQCKLELHPEKTQIVYCKDDLRRKEYSLQGFDFLGYTFRPRTARNKHGRYFVSFLPAISNKAKNAIRRVMRSWRFHRRSDKNLDDLSRICNPILRGWINYYGQYYKSALYRVFNPLNRILVRWAMRKYKRLRFHQRRATYWLRQIAVRQPMLFVHWQIIRP